MGYLPLFATVSAVSGFPVFENEIQAPLISSAIFLSFSTSVEIVPMTLVPALLKT